MWVILVPDLHLVILNHSIKLNNPLLLFIIINVYIKESGNANRFFFCLGLTHYQAVVGLTFTPAADKELWQMYEKMKE